jgi:cell division protein FtsB
MNSLYYRREPGGGKLHAAAKKLFKNKRLLFGLILGIPLLFFIIFGNRGIVQRVRLQSQKTELEAKILQAEEETKKLQAESKALDGDKRTIEKVAREKYGMVRDGETVYKVNKKK